jgi:multicomponent Na+:H+ antiporter subunit D
VPLVSAPLCVAVHRPTLAWLLATAASLAAFAISVALLLQVLESGPITYALGNWLAPWGIEYVIDSFSAYILLIVSGVGAVAMPYAYRSVKDEIGEERIYLFYTMYMLALAGLLGIVATGDAFNVFVFLEISSLSSYTLISLGRNRKALHAAYQYLIMGTIGATFFLIGVGLLYLMTGTLNMADLAERLPEISDTRPIIAAYGFIFVGVGLKLALFPLHFWLPNAYAHAPSVVTIFLAGTATKVSIYVLLRFTFTIFGAPFAFQAVGADLGLLILSIAGVLVCSLVAIFQPSIKRLLAYSSVAQVGYMMLGVSFATVLGLQAGILHMFNHAIIKAGLFLAVGCLFFRLHSTRLEDIAGVAKSMPWTMAAFVIGGLSLIGIPFTAGFQSKWYLILGAIDRGWWPIAGLIALTSLMAVVYIWRVVEAAYFRAPTKDVSALREAPASLLIPTWLLTLANLYFGVETSVSADLAGAAARMLLGGAG